MGGDSWGVRNYIKDNYRFIVITKPKIYTGSNLNISHPTNLHGIKSQNLKNDLHVVTYPGNLACKSKELEFFYTNYPQVIIKFTTPQFLINH